MIYEQFAFLYDELMRDLPYEKWEMLVEKARKTYKIEGKNLLDLGCGTGELAVRFAQNGYNVTGVDLSAEMLTIAQAKAEKKGLKINFLEQNMTKLKLIERYDLIGSFCDSFNYLETEEEVAQTLERVYHYLNAGGLFIFDVHSTYKMDEIFSNQTFIYDEDPICYIWNCFEGDYPHSVAHELTFFVEDGQGKYDRIDENHVQRTFPLATYKRWLTEKGFELLEVSGDFTAEVHDKSERILFIARKK